MLGPDSKGETRGGGILSLLIMIIEQKAKTITPRSPEVSTHIFQTKHLHDSHELLIHVSMRGGSLVCRLLPTRKGTRGGKGS